jgi:tRNA threonylcarbamoyladenosine biosynthesis protein TsaE
VVEPSVVCSPTFVLVQEYDAFRSLPDGGRRAFTLYHLDLYRLRSPEELADIGGDDILNGDGVCVVEWAERAGPLLPPGTLRVQLEVLSERSRRVTLTADDDRFADCAQGRSAS